MKSLSGETVSRELDSILFLEGILVILWNNRVHYHGSYETVIVRYLIT